MIRVYKEVTDCYYVKTATLCGLKGAHVMKNLMRHVFDKILTVECNVKANPSVPDAMPDSATVISKVR